MIFLIEIKKEPVELVGEMIRYRMTPAEMAKAYGIDVNTMRQVLAQGLEPYKAKVKAMKDQAFVEEWRRTMSWLRKLGWRTE